MIPAGHFFEKHNMKCLRCENEANPNFGKGIYCSRACSNRRTHSVETKAKISKSVVKRGAIRPPLSGESLDKWKNSIKQTYVRKFNNTPFSDLGWEGKRKRVIEEQQNKCLICNLSEWNNIPLTLEVDHIDGDNNNNARDNLRGLCPNCHSTTHTWRGKNKPQQNGGKVSDEDLLTLLKSEGNIRKALLKAGLAAKGKNYERAKKLLFNQ